MVNSNLPSDPGFRLKDQITSDVNSEQLAEFGTTQFQPSTTSASSTSAASNLQSSSVQTLSSNAPTRYAISNSFQRSQLTTTDATIPINSLFGSTINHTSSSGPLTHISRGVSSSTGSTLLRPGVLNFSVNKSNVNSYSDCTTSMLTPTGPAKSSSTVQGVNTMRSNNLSPISSLRASQPPKFGNCPCGSVSSFSLAAPQFVGHHSENEQKYINKFSCPTKVEELRLTNTNASTSYDGQTDHSSNNPTLESPQIVGGTSNDSSSAATCGSTNCQTDYICTPPPHKKYRHALNINSTPAETPPALRFELPLQSNQNGGVGSTNSKKKKKKNRKKKKAATCQEQLFGQSSSTIQQQVSTLLPSKSQPSVSICVVSAESQPFDQTVYGLPQTYPSASLTSTPMGPTQLTLPTSGFTNSNQPSTFASGSSSLYQQSGPILSIRGTAPPQQHYIESPPQHIPVFSVPDHSGSFTPMPNQPTFINTGIPEPLHHSAPASSLPRENVHHLVSRETETPVTQTSFTIGIPSTLGQTFTINVNPSSNQQASPTFNFSLRIGHTNDTMFNPNQANQ